MVQVETIEHTADVGIRVTAASAQEAFGAVAEAMFDIMVPGRAGVEARERWHVSASAEGWDDLLVGWLEELLFTYETERLVLAAIDFQRLEPTALEAIVAGERFDPERHEAGVQIKAVTYHILRAEQTDSGFLAQVIFDI